MFREWWSKPNKEWFKIGKLTLTILRAIIFLIFLSLTSIYQAFNIKTNANTTQYLAELCLYLSLIYNWRFLITVLLIFLLVLLKIFQLIFTEATNRFYLKAKTLLNKSIKALHWSQLDWPCFLRLKYFLYYYDLIHYLVFFISVLVVGIIEIIKEKQSQPPIIAFFMNGLIFLLNVLLELYRIIQAQRVQTAIRDIFASDFKFSHKAKAMIPESELGSMICATNPSTNCLITDSQHRALSHPKDLFKIKFEDVKLNQRGVNIAVGFHQTTIEVARMILTTSFKLSEDGMIGPGIYFANNYDITEHKRNQSTEGGAIFCAKIDMGKVCVIDNKIDDTDLSKKFNSKYLAHGGGEKYDEFVIYNENQIIEYTIVVEQEAIDNFRKNVNKPYCNCIKFI